MALFGRHSAVPNRIAKKARVTAELSCTACIYADETLPSVIRICCSTIARYLPP